MEGAGLPDAEKTFKVAINKSSVFILVATVYFAKASSVTLRVCYRLQSTTEWLTHFCLVKNVPFKTILPF